jgi:hypothetical protein
VEDRRQVPGLLRQMPMLRPITSASCNHSNGAPNSFPATRE